MFFAHRLIFSGTEGVRSRFPVFRSRTCFWRCGGRRVPFSCFALLDTFSTIPRALGPVFMFSTSTLVFVGTEDVGSRFHIFSFPDSFLVVQMKTTPVHFSCFALPDMFSAVPSASGPVFMCCAPVLVFGGTKGVKSRFHVLRGRTHFRRYRGHPILFSCFPLPDMFLSVQRASGPVFIFCAPRHVFCGTEGVGSRYNVLCVRTHFRRYQGHQAPFSCFALPDSFSVEPRASAPIFIFFRSWTRFRRYGGCRVPFSCFKRPDSFSAVPWG
jgi:hypothetical protein